MNGIAGSILSTITGAGRQREAQPQRQGLDPIINNPSREQLRFLSIPNSLRPNQR